MEKRQRQAVTPLPGFRINESIPKYAGKTDVVLWIRQARTVKKVLRLSNYDEANLTALSLQGPAFKIYERLPGRHQEDFEKIVEALLRAFGEDAFEAHLWLKTRKYIAGQGVDVFLTELRSLASLTGACEDTVRLDFITGLPPEVSKRLRSTPKILVTDMEEILDAARPMVKSYEESGPSSVAAAVPSSVAAPVLDPSGERAPANSLASDGGDGDGIGNNCPGRPAWRLL